MDMMYFTKYLANPVVKYVFIINMLLISINFESVKS